MRVVLLGAVLVLAGCAGGHRAVAPACTLRLAPAASASPETGEHPVALATSCATEITPRVEVLGLHGARLPFTYVEEGGRKGAHTILLDKYRCDVRYVDLGHEVVLAGARLDIGRSLLDWCPGEAVSTVIHVYLGGRHAHATWRGVLHDVYDGRLDHVWPCAALRGAIAHLPVDGMTYSAIPGKLAHAAARACNTQLEDIAVGAPRSAVAEALGKPDIPGSHCTVWRWTPATGSVDGARVCFARGRAVLVQTALHG